MNKIILFFIVFLFSCNKKYENFSIRRAEEQLDEMVYIYFFGGNNYLDGKWEMNLFFNRGEHPIDYFNDTINFDVTNKQWNLIYTRNLKSGEGGYSPFACMETNILLQLKQYYSTNHYVRQHYRKHAVDIFLKKFEFYSNSKLDEEAYYSDKLPQD